MFVNRKYRIDVVDIQTIVGCYLVMEWIRERRKYELRRHVFAGIKKYSKGIRN